MFDIPILVGLTIALTEMLKRVGMGQRFIPLIAFLIGIVLNYFTKTIGVNLSEIIIGGAMIGLAGSGVWDISKITILGKK